jgi:hypothetical protein
MPKYGWFKLQSLPPLVEYEADFMEMDKEYVRLYKHAEYQPGSMNVTAKLVAAIRLDKGQDVREIS